MVYYNEYDTSVFTTDDLKNRICIRIWQGKTRVGLANET